MAVGRAWPPLIVMPLLLIRLGKLDKHMYLDLDLLLDPPDLQLGLLNLNMELQKGKMGLWRGLVQLQLDFELELIRI
jgi:hypothetical protein